MTRATHLNPSGIRTYDHTELADLPAYRTTSNAIRTLARAITDAGIPLAVDAFFEALTDIAAGAYLADGCPDCPGQSVTPHRVDHDDRGTVGHYRCARGHEWHTSYGLRGLAELRRGLA